MKRKMRWRVSGFVFFKNEALTAHRAHAPLHRGITYSKCRKQLSTSFTKVYFWVRVHVLGTRSCVELCGFNMKTKKGKSQNLPENVALDSNQSNEFSGKVKKLSKKVYISTYFHLLSPTSLSALALVSVRELVCSDAVIHAEIHLWVHISLGSP